MVTFNFLKLILSFSMLLMAGIFALPLFIVDFTVAGGFHLCSTGLNLRTHAQDSLEIMHAKDISEKGMFAAPSG